MSQLEVNLEVNHINTGRVGCIHAAIAIMASIVQWWSSSSSCFLRPLECHGLAWLAVICLQAVAHPVCMSIGGVSFIYTHTHIYIYIYIYILFMSECNFFLYIHTHILYLFDFLLLMEPSTSLYDRLTPILSNLVQVWWVVQEISKPLRIYPPSLFLQKF